MANPSGADVDTLADDVAGIHLDVGTGGEEAKSPWTAEEVEAFVGVRKALLEAGGVAEEFVRDNLLTIITMICKLRVDKAVGKYKDFLGIMTQFGIGMEDIDVDGTSDFEVCTPYWDRYKVQLFLTPKRSMSRSSPTRSACMSFCFIQLSPLRLSQVCGRDRQGSSIMWIAVRSSK